MSKNDAQLANTREKLRELEERYETRRQETPPNPHVHAATLRSLAALMKQLKEEIARYEAHQRLPRAAARS